MNTLSGGPKSCHGKLSCPHVDAGGGGGSLGIVTSFTIKTYPAPEVTTIFQTNWDLNDTVPTLTWFQKNAPYFPNELSSDLSVSSSNTQFSGLFAGTKQRLLDILDGAGYHHLPPRKSEDIRELPYIQAALYHAVQSQGLKPADDINSLGLGPGTSLPTTRLDTTPSWAAGGLKTAACINAIVNQHTCLLRHEGPCGSPDATAFATAC